MNTDNFIEALAGDAPCERPLREVIVPRVILAAGITIAIVWAVLGFRKDLGTSFLHPVSVMRFIMTGALAVTAVKTGLLLSRPEGPQTARMWPFAAVGLLALGLILWAFAVTPADARYGAVVGKTLVTCLTAIPLLSVLPVATLFSVLRKGAVTAPRLAGLIAGLGGGGIGAMAYATYCGEDSPLFYVTWYGLAIAAVAIVSALIGPRLLRW